MFLDKAAEYYEKALTYNSSEDYQQALIFITSQQSWVMQRRRILLVFTISTATELRRITPKLLNGFTRLPPRTMYMPPIIWAGAMKTDRV